MKLFYLLLLLCFFAACTSNKEIPKDIIAINRMKLVVWDMIRAGELAKNQYIKDSGMVKVKTLENFQQVFSVYGISKDDFYKSYTYYEKHPDKNKILMDSVMAFAGRQRSLLYKKIQ